MTAFPDVWQEICRVGIIPENGSLMDWGGCTEEISSIKFGNKDIDIKSLVNGGYITTFSPRDAGEITLKIYDVNGSIESNNGADQMFDPGTFAPTWGVDSTQPIIASASVYRRKFGLVILWATVLPSSASALPTLGECARRIEVINAYMTVNEKSYPDKILCADVTFKFAPLDRNAAPNYRICSTDGTAQLPTCVTLATAFP